MDKTFSNFPIRNSKQAIVAGNDWDEVDVDVDDDDV